MYSESGFQFSCSQSQASSISTQVLPPHNLRSARNIVQTTVSGYNIGGEGDLFKAPDPLMEEAVLGLDPMNLFSKIPNEEDITGHAIKVSDINSIQTESLLSETSTLPEFDLGGKRNLLKAPEPMEEPRLGYDPMVATTSMISCSEGVISASMVKAADIEQFQNEHLLSEILNEYKNELMENSAVDESFLKVLDVKASSVRMQKDLTVEKEGLIAGGSTQENISSGSLTSTDWMNGGTMRPSLMDFQTMDLGDALGMRRAFSEGDVQILGNGNVPGNFPFNQLLTTGNYITEERWLRLSRYRIKKTKRNFGRKIKKKQKDFSEQLQRLH